MLYWVEQAIIMYHTCPVMGNVLQTDRNDTFNVMKSYHLVIRGLEIFVTFCEMERDRGPIVKPAHIGHGPRLTLLSSGIFGS